MNTTPRDTTCGEQLQRCAATSLDVDVSIGDRDLRDEVTQEVPDHDPVLREQQFAKRGLELVKAGLPCRGGSAGGRSGKTLARSCASSSRFARSSRIDRAELDSGDAYEAISRALGLNSFEHCPGTRDWRRQSAVRACCRHSGRPPMPQPDKRRDDGEATCEPPGRAGTHRHGHALGAPRPRAPPASAGAEHAAA